MDVRSSCRVPSAGPAPRYDTYTIRSVPVADSYIEYLPTVPIAEDPQRRQLNINFLFFVFVFCFSRAPPPHRNKKMRAYMCMGGWVGKIIHTVYASCRAVAGIGVGHEINTYYPHKATTKLYKNYTHAHKMYMIYSTYFTYGYLPTHAY